jgi:hypothetical protein
VGPGAGLDPVEKRKFSCSHRESTPSVQSFVIATEVFWVKNLVTVIEESSKFHSVLFVFVL